MALDILADLVMASKQRAKQNRAKLLVIVSAQDHKVNPIPANEGREFRNPDQKRVDIEALCAPGETGQFDVIADGERIAERSGN